MMIGANLPYVLHTENAAGKNSGVSDVPAFGRKVSGFDLQPGDALGIRVGSTLAATPEISLTLGLGLTFLAESERDNQKIDGSARTIGFLELGSGIILSEHLFLAVSGQFGVTEDAPDMSLKVALPIRF